MTPDLCKHELDPATCSICLGRDHLVDDDPISDAATTTCRSCRATIVWTMSSAGRKMPVDAEPVDGGNVIARGDHDQGLPVVVVTRNGDPPPSGPTYTSHFATCAQADKWRRR